MDSLPEIGRGIWGGGDSDGSDIPVAYEQPHWSHADSVSFLCCRLQLKWAQRVAWGLALMCVIESALAALQRHYVGIIAGLLAAAASWYLTAAMRVGHYARTRVFHVMTFVASALGLYIVGLIVVRLMSGVIDEGIPFRSFPAGCPPGIGCARLALEAPQGKNLGGVPSFEADAGQVMDAALNAVRPQALVHRVSPASDEPKYLQLVWLSFVWGFPDDVAISISCNGTRALMQVQSQQRLGTDDFGVNAQHVREIVRAVAAGLASAVPLRCVVA